MKERILRLFLAIVCINTYISAVSQENSEWVGLSSIISDSLKNSGIIFNDNRKRPEIVLSTSQAVRFLQQRFQHQYWNHARDPFRLALGQLIYEASHPPYDKSEYFLKRYPYDSLSIPWDKFYIWEPLRLKIPEIVHRRFTIPINSSIKADTNLTVSKNDSLKLQRATLAEPFAALKPVIAMKDTTIMVIIDTLNEVTSSKSGFPFKYLTFPYQADSIQVAVKSLLKYLERRDSTIIHFTGIGNV